MATKRMISTSLPDSEKLMDCSSDTVRLLFVWLCLTVDDDGRMQCQPRTIKKKFFGDRDSIKVQHCEKMLQELSEKGLIFTYQEKDPPRRSFLSIPKWTCINKIRKDLYKPSEILPFSASLHVALHNSNVYVTDKHPRVVKVSIEKKSKEAFGSFVRMEKEEYDKLINDYDQKLIKKLIEELDLYIGSTGKKYVSHYHTIRAWANKRIEEGTPVKAKSDWSGARCPICNKGVLFFKNIRYRCPVCKSNSNKAIPYYNGETAQIRFQFRDGKEVESEI